MSGKIMLWTLALCAVLGARALAQDNGGPAAEAPTAEQPAAEQPAADPPTADAPASEPPAAAVPAVPKSPTKAGATKKSHAKPAAKPGAEDSQGLAVDKARFEAYLKERLAKIDEQQRIRTEFFSREKKDWESFWGMIRKERRDFEFRLTRQTLDLFDSLASLDANGQNTTIGNFERLQTDFIRSFEAGQKAKMNDFFNLRDSRWKEFASEQERERVEFTTDAETGWEQQKSSLGVTSGSSKKSKKKQPKVVDASEPPKQDGPAPGTVIKAHPDGESGKSPLRKEKPSGGGGEEDVWH